MARARAEEARQGIFVDYDFWFLVFADTDVITQHLPETTSEQWVDIDFDYFACFHSITLLNRYQR